MSSKKSLFGSLKDNLKSALRTEASGDQLPAKGQHNEAATTSTRPAMSSNPFSGSSRDLPPPPPYVAVQEDNTAPPAALTGGAATRTKSRSPAPSLASVTNDEDKYAFLSTFDTIFLIDDSSSMRGSRWAEVDRALQAITPICTSHDQDGIDLYFLNHKSGQDGPSGTAKNGYYNITSTDQVRSIFRRVAPTGATPTGIRLGNILNKYIRTLEVAEEMEDVKPVNIIVITDGRPTDEPESIIIDNARHLDSLRAPSHQVGIQFFQVGHDRGAAEALKLLDDELSHQGVRDMVDTVSWDDTTPFSQRTLTADGILKVVLGAVVRRLDRKQTTNTGRSLT